MGLVASVCQPSTLRMDAHATDLVGLFKPDVLLGSTTGNLVALQALPVDPAELAQSLHERRQICLPNWFMSTPTRLLRPRREQPRQSHERFEHSFQDSIVITGRIHGRNVSCYGWSK
jgi:hypothetical protein